MISCSSQQHSVRAEVMCGIAELDVFQGHLSCGSPLPPSGHELSCTAIKHICVGQRGCDAATELSDISKTPRPPPDTPAHHTLPRA